MRTFILGILMIFSTGSIAAGKNDALQGCIEAIGERHGVTSEAKPFSERKSGSNFEYRLNGVDADGQEKKFKCKVNKRGAVLKLDMRGGHWS
ncbi:MAG: hypothetical protein WD002_12935 [Pseudomonadales bacterium]